MLLWERLQLEAHVREQQMYYKTSKKIYFERGSSVKERRGK